MSARPYLSIGDVLTLLREEFPDITISKIRFLESQGLVNPERSPSGYRKFYDHDVERLRWVLRQQREHFLPLRVIRDRLTRAGNGVPPDEPEPAAAVSGAVGEEDGGTARRARPGPGDGGGQGTTRAEPGRAPVAARVAATVAATRVAPGGTGNGTSLSVGGPGHSDGDDRSDGPDDRASGGPQSRSPGDADDDPGAQVADPAGQDTAGQDTAGGATGAEPAHAAPGPDVEPIDRSPAHAAVPSPPAAPPPRSPASARPLSPAAASAPAASPAGGGSETGTSLTLAELCEASGLTASDVAALETFDLIETVTVGGATYYDDDAATVARLAADLGRYGIEPRHLRVYRNAVEREVGLVEQVVMPLLRQRNPAARQRAVDAATELTRLGEGLRAALLRRELHRQLGT